MGQAFTQLGDMPVTVFLRDYWQKKPLLIRRALPDFISPLTPDDLAGLALEDTIESRIITQTESQPWQLTCGPFTETTFQTLPEKNWTLLVQAVDHVIPEMTELLDRFRFIPNWRLDDIMASYAPTGGSVGPHFDQYDVFLLQGAGSREWKIGQQCDERSACLENTPLHILKTFHTEETYTVHPGDILYIPPGVAHWGVSQDDECITYSVGFRAPSYTDILCGLTQDIAEQLPASKRLLDSQVQPAKNPGLIDPTTIQAVQDIVLSQITPDKIAQWFGRTMSEVKYPDNADDDTYLTADNATQDFEVALQENLTLIRNPASRFCYYPTDNKNHCFLYIDGSDFICTQAVAEFLCENSSFPIVKLADVETRTLIIDLINKQSLLIDL